MKIQVSNIKSKLLTDNPKLLKALVNLYTFKVPGSEFSPAYRARRWSGDKKFISDSGVFRTGLLPRVLRDLRKVECIPEIKYEKTKLSVTPHNWQIEGFTYYDYQEALILKAINNQRGIIKAPT